MIEIGSTVRATVERIEPYGLFLRHEGEPIVVLLPEVSWTDTRDLRQRFRPGQAVDVQVFRYNYQDQVAVGSIRRLQAEQNPYRQLSRLPPGTVLHGKVSSTIGDEVQVSLGQNVRGYISNSRLGGEVRTGDVVDVTITSLDVDEGRLQLDVARHSDAPGSQHPVAAVGTGGS